VHQFVGEQSGWTKPLLPILPKIHNLVISSCCIFRLSWQWFYKRPTDICNKSHKQEINQILHILRT
jgi:hypothetical protein